MEFQILEREEIKKFNKQPNFSSNEQIYYFELTGNFLKKIKLLFKYENIAYFVLQYGYFKATNRFFSIKNINRDLEYIKNRYDLEEIVINIPRNTLQRYKKIIKEYLNIQEYGTFAKESLEQEAIKLANNFTHRKKIFFSLVDLSKRLNIEIPSYTELSRIISKALNVQEKEITDKLESWLNDDRLKELDEFLDKNEEYKNRYNLMSYKRLEHSTRKGKIQSSILKFQTIKFKYKSNKEIIESVGITPKIAEYYSKWIEKSQVSQVMQKKEVNIYFLLLSFVYYQFLIRSDNLMDRFISVVQSAKSSVLRAEKDFIYADAPSKNRVIESLKELNLSILNEISLITKNENLSATKKVERIEEILELKNKEFKRFDSVENQESCKYKFIEQKSISLQGKLSSIVKEVEFDENASNTNLIKAIEYFKRVDGNIKRDAPKEFLTKEEQEIVFGEKFKVSLYKALFFFAVSDGVKSGALNLKYSYRYQNFDRYLIDKDEWDSNKSEILNSNEMQHLKSMSELLKPIEEKLDRSFETTNRRIIKELNTNFTFKNNSFTLKTPRVERDENDNISEYFPKNSYLSIIDVLRTINQKTGFLNLLTYFNPNYNSKIDSNLLFATIVGYGCNINISKMNKISKGINPNQLENTKLWYFTVENTMESNDRIIEFMNDIEVVKLLRENEDINHTSSDGQKFNIKSSIDSMNAGYSFKYFGTGKGVSVYTFIDESHRLFYSKVINAQERESGYVLDGLMSNEVIKSDIHSTDTHGYSEVIFAITHLLGFSFAPRIKNFKEQHLYSFKYPKEYKGLGYKILPKRKIKVDLIKESWDEILRFIATIKSRKTTASQLLHRLTSYSKQHKLYRALKEFGKIIKTDFLLQYIDDVELRQRIEKQLNKVENSNKFSKAVFFGNNSEFQVSTTEEQNIANNCKRLIQNSVILWNYLYISKKIEDTKSYEEREQIIKAIKNSSIIHWSHINFYGEYDFTNRKKLKFDL